MKTTKKNNTLKQIWRLITDSRKPVCCIDSRLDCDAVSSALALHYLVAHHHHRRLSLYFIGDIPTNFKSIYQDIDDFHNIATNVDPSNIDFRQYDLLIALDTNNYLHMSDNSDFKIPGIPIVNIDHHYETNTFFGTQNHVKNVAATCLLVYELARQNHLTISSKIAQLLLLGLLEDTESFQFDKVSPQDLIVAAKLFKISKKNVFDFTFRLRFHESPLDMVIRQIVFKNYRFEPKNKIAYSFITFNDLREHQLDISYSPGISPVEEIRRVEGTNFTFFLREKHDPRLGRFFNISFRSRLSGFDVSRIAQRFGGGGHKMSAGGRIVTQDSVKQVIKTIIRVATKENPLQ